MGRVDLEQLVALAMDLDAVVYFDYWCMDEHEEDPGARCVMTAHLHWVEDDFCSHDAWTDLVCYWPDKSEPYLPWLDRFEDMWSAVLNDPLGRLGILTGAPWPTLEIL